MVVRFFFFVHCIACGAWDWSCRGAVGAVIEWGVLVSG